MGSKKCKKKIKSKKIARIAKGRKAHLNELGDSADVGESLSLNDFSQIRKNYFEHLQNVIKENLRSLDDNDGFSLQSLEKISLEIEQEALLACMQSDIYRKIMVKIIHDIKKSTQQMKLHLGIKNIILLRNLEYNEVLKRLKKEGESTEGSGQIAESEEVYSHIPIISSVRPNYNEYTSDWRNDDITENTYETPVNRFNCEADLLQPGTDESQAQDVIQTLYPSSIDEYYSSIDLCNTSEHESFNMTERGENNEGAAVEMENRTCLLQNLVPLTVSNSEQNFSSNEEQICDSSLSVETAHISNGELLVTNDIDPILKSRNQLQKSVEKSLKTLREERERAQIARILEDDFDEDDNQYGTPSDNCDDWNMDQHEDDDVKGKDLLSDRLEEMRQIFGVDDNEHDAEESVVQEETTAKTNRTVERSICMSHRKIRKPSSVWYHERVIQMYKLALLSSEMTLDMRNRKMALLREYFGDDSDEENELHFQSEEKYLTSCRERIVSWVVKYLMPFYHKKRIVGRNVFKSLGHHVANSIIEQILYPDEWTVRYFITKFFPPHKQFTNESDIWAFQIE